jgi:hypothetical protein
LEVLFEVQWEEQEWESLEKKVKKNLLGRQQMESSDA